MDDSPGFPLLTLSELPRIGERSATRVLQLARTKGVSLADILTLPPHVLENEFGLPAPAVARLSSEGAAHIAHCRHIASHLRELHARVHQPGDPGYPPNWLQWAERAPPVVCLYGSQAVLTRPTVAVLNSRGITAHAVAATVRIAQCTAREGLTLATGGMKTMHRIAAVTTRAAGAPRAIVLDRGLFAAFGARLERDPFGFGPGRLRFDARATLVLSVFRASDSATPRSGRRRDELIAALADVIVAASARPGGEVERICVNALDRGQCVLSWQGANLGLLAAGARAIDEADLNGGLRQFLPSSRT